MIFNSIVLASISKSAAVTPVDPKFPPFHQDRQQFEEICHHEFTGSFVVMMLVATLSNDLMA